MILGYLICSILTIYLVIKDWISYEDFTVGDLFPVLVLFLLGPLGLLFTLFVIKRNTVLIKKKTVQND